MSVLHQIGKIRVPISEYTAQLTDLAIYPAQGITYPLQSAETTRATTIGQTMHRTWMTFGSSFIVYMIALVSFVGWFLFAVSRLCIVIVERSHPIPWQSLSFLVVVI